MAEQKSSYITNNDPPLKADTWHEYYEGEYDSEFPRLLGNIDGREQTALALNEMIKSSKSDAEIVSKMMEFVKESFQLVHDFTDKWYNEPEKYGLPNPNKPSRAHP